MCMMCADVCMMPAALKLVKAELLLGQARLHSKYEHVLLTELVHPMAGLSLQDSDHSTLWVAPAPALAASSPQQDPRTLTSVLEGLPHRRPTTEVTRTTTQKASLFSYATACTSSGLETKKVKSQKARGDHWRVEEHAHTHTEVLLVVRAYQCNSPGHIQRSIHHATP